MLKELLKHPSALFLAVLVHVALIAILVVSIQWNSKPAALQGSDEIVQATVIDETKLQAEKQRKLDEEEAKRRAEEQKKQAELDRQRVAEQRKREAQQAAEKKKQQAAEQQRQAKIKADKEAKEHKRIEEQKRLAEQESKRKIEEQRRQAEETKRKAEEQRKADEARRQRENEEMLKQQLAQEEADRAAQAKAEQRQRELASMQDQYSAILRQWVTRNWIRPPSAHAGMSCTVHVRLIPGGEVVEARTVKSSGDPAFDRSAETALLRSSPWPKPPDPALFQREVNFIFRPEG
jgi:colicin import membrane protein